MIELVDGFGPVARAQRPHTLNTKTVLDLALLVSKWIVRPQNHRCRVHREPPNLNGNHFRLPMGRMYVPAHLPGKCKRDQRLTAQAVGCEPMLFYC